MKYFIVVALASLFVPVLLSGDGGIIPPNYEEIYGTGQTALITIRGGTETIVPLIEVSGEITNFIWMFPCPDIPSVDSASVLLFYDLALWSAPKYVQRGWQGCCTDMQPTPEDGFYDGRGEDNGVDPIGNGSIGFLSYEILQATDANELVLYLQGNGYNVPQDAESIFQYYIAKDWNYFIAAVCDTENASWYNNGTNIQPMVISFHSDNPVFPLRISRIGSIDSEIVLYIIANNKMVFASAEVKFAKRIDQSFIDDIGYSDASDYFWDGSFLTKCYAFIEKEEMDDLLIENAPDNDEFEQIHFYSKQSLDPVLFLCCFVLFVVYRQRYSKGGEK